MMQHEPQAVKEIHEIRENLYEQQKDFTDAQLLEYYQNIGTRYTKAHNLELVPCHQPDSHRKAG
jgi:hypothetical protein